MTDVLHRFATGSAISRTETSVVAATSTQPTARRLRTLADAHPATRAALAATRRCARPHCRREFIELQNAGQWACLFHPGWYDPVAHAYSCCGRGERAWPCRRADHTECEFPMGTKYALEIPTFLQPLFKPPLAETTLASVDEARVGGWTLQDPRVAEEVPRDRADEEVYRTYVDTRRALVMRGDYRVK